MDPTTANQWLTLAANAGVITGLILVAIQIRQNTQITKAQITNDYYLVDMQLELKMMGEDPAKSWVKSVYTPNELTREDAVILDRYFNYGLVQLKRLQKMYELGLADDDWEKRTYYLGWHLGNEIGARWWSASKDDFPDDFVQTVDEILIDRAFKANQELLDALLPQKSANQNL